MLTMVRIFQKGAFVDMILMVVMATQYPRKSHINSHVSWLFLPLSSTIVVSLHLQMKSLQCCHEISYLESPIFRIQSSIVGFIRTYDI